MGLPLTQAQAPGSTDALEYQAEDFLGVQAPRQSPTDHTGPNEFSRWTRDAKEWMEVHHDTSGVHKYLGIAKRVVYLYWDGSIYIVLKQYPSTETFTVTRVSAGLIKLEWTTALGSATYSGDAMCPIEPASVPGTDPKKFAIGQLFDDGTGSIVRTSKRVHFKRFEGTTLAGLTLTDGNIHIRIFDT